MVYESLIRLLLLDFQFRGASARMRESYDVIMKEIAKEYQGDLERFRISNLLNSRSQLPCGAAASAPAKLSFAI